MDKEQEAVEQPEQGDAVDAAVEVTDSEGAENVSEQELRGQLEAALAKVDEQREQMMRVAAEMDNLRKRSARDLENAHKFALERFVNELLPVMDSMELGLSAAQDEAADVAKLREGTDLTLKMFAGVMEKFEVVQIDPEGQPFDPEFHQAMSMMPRDDVPANTVVTVVQKGYTLNGRLVRPAMVMVSQAG